MNNHKSALRKFDPLKPTTDCHALYEHLHSCSKTHASPVNQTNSVFKFIILDSLKNVKDLDKFEKNWIWKLNTVVPNGLNINDGFNVQTRKSRNVKT
jgi:hypothetical protein